MQTVEAVMDRYCAAASDRDIEAMVNLYAPAFRIFDMMVPWQNRSLDAWRKSVEDWFEGSGAQPGAEANQIESVTTEGMAYLTAIMTYFHEGKDGDRQSMDNRLSWVLMPFGDDWKIVHEHSSIPWSETEGQPEWQFTPE